MRLKVLCVLLLACSTSQHPGIVGNLVDCGKADRGQLLGLLTELGVAAVRDVSTSEAVNWKALGLKAAAKGVTVGGCAFAQFVRGYVKAETPPIADGAVALMAPDPAIVELEALRAQWGGVTWSVER